MTAEVVNTYVVRMTPDMAAAWLQQYDYEYQRKATKSKVAQYADQMQRGKWVPGTSLKLGLIGDNGTAAKLLLDGRHRLLAIVASGVPQVFAVTELRCLTEQDVAFVYSTTDRGRPRNADDLYRTTHIADEIGVSQRVLRKAGAALQFMTVGFLRGGPMGNTPLDYDALLAAFRTYGEAIGNYAEVVGMTTQAVMTEPLLRASTFAVAIATYHHAAEVYGLQRVDDFWEGVAIDDGLRRTDPRKVANVHIATSRIAYNRGGREGRMTSPNYSARYIAACWNNWTDGRKYSESAKGVSAKVFNSAAPIKINGTPWKG